MNLKFNKTVILSLISIFVVVSSASLGVLYFSIEENNKTNTSIEITNDFTYAIVDTNQIIFYDNTNVISEPSLGDYFYGQDAQYSRFTTSYHDNGDETATDLNT